MERNYGAKNHENEGDAAQAPALHRTRRRQISEGVEHQESDDAPRRPSHESAIEHHPTAYQEDPSGEYENRRRYGARYAKASWEDAIRPCRSSSIGRRPPRDTKSQPRLE